MFGILNPLGLKLNKLYYLELLKPWLPEAITPFTSKVTGSDPAVAVLAAAFKLQVSQILDEDQWFTLEPQVFSKCQIQCSLSTQ